jgi:hypothetical protein
MAEQKSRLEALLDRLQKFGLQVNPKKVQLGVSRISLLGHVVSDKGIEPDEGRVEVIKNYPVPTSPQELTRFLGLLSPFYS